MSKRNKPTSRKVDRDHMSLFLNNNVDIDHRIIHLIDEIDASTTSNVIKGIQLMLKKNQEYPIHIYINSYGGCPYAGLGLYSFIRTIKNTEIYTYNTGAVMSSATLIFLAGDKKFTYQESVFMFHTVSSYAEGKLYPVLANETDECKALHKQMCKIYAATTHRDYKFWFSHIKYEDRNYRSEMAKNMGIVDEILE